MILSISLPDGLTTELDRLIERRGHKGRSEAVRAALVQFLKQQRQEEELHGTVNAVVVLGYPERAERAVSELRHEHVELVSSVLHAHTPKGQCATVMMADGPAEKVRRLLSQLRGLRDLGSVEVTLLK